MASASVLLSVPAADWGERQVLDVDGDRAVECDRVNDRADIFVDVCRPEQQLPTETPDLQLDWR